MRLWRQTRHVVRVEGKVMSFHGITKALRWRDSAISACALGAGLLCGQAAQAEGPSSDDLQEVTVTGHQTLPLEVHPSVGKLDTSIADTPRSIQIVPRELMDDQGAVRLTDVLSNVSGAAQGGQFAFGFFDRAVLRGLNISYLTDGISDGASELTGIPHSLTGVERVEVIKGPGSALYGVSQQGGTVNLVHYRPADRFGFSLSEQYGSFDSTTTTLGVTGPTGISSVDYRLDAGFDHAGGFRGTSHSFLELFPAASWRPEGHDVELRLEYRKLQILPDAAGIPFSPPSATGLPADVDVDNRYYTPFARGDQKITRLLASDAWTLDGDFVLNNRMSFSHRTVDIARNAGGSVALLGSEYGLRNRQLRQQQDSVDDLLYQIELNGRFAVGSLENHILVGAQVDKTDGHTRRSTADLPNIANLNEPLIADSPAALVFRCDATHSCDDADISDRFWSVYAIDQIDVTDRFKLRGSVRGDSFKTEGVATSAIPVNPGMEQPCTPPRAALCPWAVGVPVQRTDNLFSWDAGAVYYLTRELSSFVGASDSHLPIFNTEEPESIGSVPESGTQYEGGLRFSPGRRLAVATAVYQVKRNSIFTVLLDPQTGLDIPATFSYRVRGWEADLNAEPIDGWSIVGNFSHQNARISDYPQAPGAVGHLVPSVAPNLANLWTSYDVRLGGGLGFLRLKAGARYRQRAYTDANNTRILPGSTLIDAGISWVLPRVELAVGVDDLADRANWLYGAGTGGGAVPGPGRTVFGRVTARLE